MHGPAKSSILVGVERHRHTNRHKSSFAYCFGSEGRSHPILNDLNLTSSVSRRSRGICGTLFTRATMLTRPTRGLVACGSERTATTLCGPFQRI